MEYVATLRRQGILNSGNIASKNHNEQRLVSMHGGDELNMLKRLTKVNKERITSLEEEVSQLTKKIAELNNFFEKIKDKEVVANARLAIQNRRDRPPVDRPIDRNNVAPKDVQIESIFYAGRR